MKKRILSYILTLCMLVSMLTIVPMTANAVAPTVWDGSVADDYASGTGTESDPYMINTAQQFAYFEQQVNSGTTTTGVYFKLGADIILNEGNASDWATIAPTNKFNPIGLYKHVTEGITAADNTVRQYAFKGNFNGNGHTISGLYANVMGTYENQGTGLFGIIGTGAVIKNFAVVNSYVKSNRAIGVIGLALNSGAEGNFLVDSIYSDIIAEGTSNVGGIIGQLSDTAGGVYGYTATISNCLFTGSVIGTKESSIGSSACGGILGNGNSRFIQVINCLNTGSVKASGSYIAGIVGRNDVKTIIANCINIGDIIQTGTSEYTAGIWSGALKANNTVTMTECYSTGNTLFINSTNYGTITPTNVGYFNERFLGTNAQVFEGWTARAADIMVPTAVVGYLSTDVLNSNILTLSGAAVRLIEPTGLRFSGLVSKAYIDDLKIQYGDENVSFGMIITPASYLSDLGEFTVEALEAAGKAYELIEASSIANIETVEEDGFYKFNAVLSNVKPENKSVIFSAITYVRYNDGENTSYKYANTTMSRSINMVAERALSDVSSTYNSEYKYLITGGSHDGKYSLYSDAQRDILIGIIQTISQTVWSNIPNYTYGTLADEYTVGEAKYDIDCYALKYTDTTIEGFNTYHTKLLNGGFILHANNGVYGIDGQCYQATYYNDDYTVNVTYYVNTNETFITAEEKRALSEFQQAPASTVYGTKVTYANPRHPTINGSYKFGEMDIFQLTNGHFIVVDGAQEYSAELLVTTLESLVDDNSIPIIDAWFFTHAHPDHIYCAWGVGRDPDLVSRIRVQGFYYTWPNDEGARREKDYNGLCKQIANLNSVFDNYRTVNGTVVPRYKLHAGMKFYIEEIEVQILMTQDQLMPNEYLSYNDSSTSFKFIVHIENADDTTFLIMGDGNKPVCNKLMGKYSYDTLHTNFFLSLHHGSNDYAEFFRYIAPDYLIYTAPGIKTATGYAWLNSNCKGYLLNGTSITITEDGYGWHSDYTNAIVMKE